VRCPLLPHFQQERLDFLIFEMKGLHGSHAQELLETTLRHNPNEIRSERTEQGADNQRNSLRRWCAVRCAASADCPAPSRSARRLGWKIRPRQVRIVFTRPISRVPRPCFAGSITPSMKRAGRHENGQGLPPAVCMARLRRLRVGSMSKTGMQAVVDNVYRLRADGATATPLSFIAQASHGKHCASRELRIMR
jgi:hypothetical protein